MGIYVSKMADQISRRNSAKEIESVHTFKFHDPLPEDSSNGLYFNDAYIPEEVLAIILSFIDSKDILKVSLVCKKWCNIIKSDVFWTMKYSRHCKKKPKKLPWYVYYCYFATDYFDRNLIKNGNGEDNFKYWKIILNYGDAFKIEDPPCGSDPLPLNVPEFNGRTSCFATSYYECNKLQEIPITSRLMQLILNKYKPHIYLSEWVAARFDSGCVYNIWCKLYGQRRITSRSEPGGTSVPSHRPPLESDDEDALEEDYFNSDDEHEEPYLFVKQDGISMDPGKAWSKIEMIVKDYPPGVLRIVFQHEGRDTQFWKGHYGSKMAGANLKILFDTIEPK